MYRGLTKLTLLEMVEICTGVVKRSLAKRAIQIDLVKTRGVLSVLVSDWSVESAE